MGADKAGVVAGGFYLAINGEEAERGKTERYTEADKERIEGFIVGGDISGQGGPMECDDNDRGGREGYGQ